MRVLSLLNNAWADHELGTLPEVLEKIKEDTLTWVRAGGLNEQEFDQLGEAFGLHPLIIEDVQNARQRPKVEDFPGLTFTIVRVPRYQGAELHWEQVGLFLGKDFLITASAHRLPEMDALDKELMQKGLPTGRESVCSLFHQALDTLVDAWFPFMDELEDKIDELEAQAGTAPSQETLKAIRQMKQEISRTRKVSSPMRDAMLSLERGKHPNILDETRVYLRDVSDHMVRLSERLDHVKEMALIAQETWNATLANQQNRVMKRLTVVAGLLLFPSLVAGLGGMNFERGFPDWGYWEVTGALVAFLVLGFGAAVLKKWI
jgi:magnesium transporter